MIRLYWLTGGNKMYKLLAGMLVCIICGSGYAGDVKVKGYTKKDGTYVAPDERSRLNAFKWDNKSYTPSQNPYNESYSQPTKKHNSNWTTPSETRFSDSNPNNDSQPSYYTAPARKAAPQSNYADPYTLPKAKTYETPTHTNTYSAPKINPYEPPTYTNSYTAPKVKTFEHATYTNPYSAPKTNTYQAPTYTNPYSAPKTNPYTNPYAPKSNYGFGADDSSDDSDTSGDTGW